MEKPPQIAERRRQNVWFALRWGGALLLLLVPLLAMQLSEEVNWTVGDFLFAALAIGSAGLAYEVAARTGGGAYRAAVAVAISGSVLVLWANGAVGIAGDEDNRANLLFYGVVAVGLVAAITSRARPATMVRVMGAMAVLQVAAGVATLRTDLAVIPATLVFTAFWLLAAGLFHRAAGSQAG